jgi:hypothetical protein
MWAVLAALVVVTGRAVAYALSGDAAARQLAGAGGGPAPVWIAAAALTCAAAFSIVGLWLVAIGVRERCEHELRRWTSPPPLRARAVVWRAAALAAASNAGFAILESCVHYEEGLGWHGLHCITGPVHADAAPILVGLSILAAALVAAYDHVLAAVRRAVAMLVLMRDTAAGRGARPVCRRVPGPPRGRRLQRANPTRGPPLAA